jgi:hypothetical protein
MLKRTASTSPFRYTPDSVICRICEYIQDYRSYTAFVSVNRHMKSDIAKRVKLALRFQCTADVDCVYYRNACRAYKMMSLVVDEKDFQSTLSSVADRSTITSLELYMLNCPDVVPSNVRRLVLSGTYRRPGPDTILQPLSITTCRSLQSLEVNNTRMSPCNSAAPEGSCAHLERVTVRTVPGFTNISHLMNDVCIQQLVWLCLESCLDLVSPIDIGEQLQILKLYDLEFVPCVRIREPQSALRSAKIVYLVALVSLDLENLQVITDLELGWMPQLVSLQLPTSVKVLNLSGIPSGVVNLHQLTQLSTLSITEPIGDGISKILSDMSNSVQSLVLIKCKGLQYTDLQPLVHESNPLSHLYVHMFGQLHPQEAYKKHLHVPGWDAICTNYSMDLYRDL